MALRRNNCLRLCCDHHWSQDEESGETGFSTEPCKAFLRCERTDTGYQTCLLDDGSSSMSGCTYTTSCQEDSIAGPATGRVLKRSFSASSTSGGGPFGTNCFDPAFEQDESSPFRSAYEAKDEEPTTVLADTPRTGRNDLVPSLCVSRSPDPTETSPLFPDVGSGQFGHVILCYGCLVFYLLLYLALEADMVVAPQSCWWRDSAFPSMECKSDLLLGISIFSCLCFMVIGCQHLVKCSMQ